MKRFLLTMAVVAAVAVLGGSITASGTITHRSFAAPVTRDSSSQGYVLAAADGGVFAYGSTPYEGSLTGQTLAGPIVGVAETPSGNGYWLAGRDKGIFAFGDAPFLGSQLFTSTPCAPNIACNARLVTSGGVRPLSALVFPVDSNPAVAFANEAPDGYAVALTDGGIRGYDAYSHAALSANLAGPVVGIAYSSASSGTWEAASDGGVFSTDPAVFYGSLGGQHLDAPVSGIAATPDGDGYWLVAQDGGVFTFGDAHFFGSLPSLGVKPVAPIVGMAPTADGNGYWLVGADGGVFAFGDARYLGGMAGRGLAAPIVGIAAH